MKVLTQKEFHSELSKGTGFVSQYGFKPTTNGKRIISVEKGLFLFEEKEFNGKLWSEIFNQIGE